jgi:hypothetical protein
MTTANDQPPPSGPRPRYKWPWFVLAAVVLAIVLAVLWMSKEVERLRQIRDANSPPPETNAAPANRP